MNRLKLQPFIYLILAIALGFTACSKKDKSPAPSKPDPGIVTPQAKWPANADIYFVGDFSNKTFNRVPTIWKNGVPSILNTDGRAVGVAVANGNVYVAGSVYKDNYENAVYWENGVLKRLPVLGFSEANAVAVSGNDIYIVGINHKNPTIWKNGIETPLSTLPGAATSIFVKGSDVYVAGNVYNRNSIATVWKNGKIMPLDTDGSAFENGVNALWVDGSDVYLAGWLQSTGTMMWKNGKSSVLFNGGNNISADARDITVKDGDVYVTGYIGSKTVLWKNGIVSNLPLNDRNSINNKISIAFNGNDMYISSGLDNNFEVTTSIFWLNNVAYQFGKDFNIVNGMAIVPR
jgi:hypothetical protein